MQSTSWPLRLNYKTLKKCPVFGGHYTFWFALSAFAPLFKVLIRGIIPSRWPFLSPDGRPGVWVARLLSMAELVSVIIVNWNGLEHLRTCIPAVVAQDYPNFEVIVVDNGSSDGSVAWVRSNFPQVRLVCNDANLGFAAGNNQGFQIMRGVYAALLNNDARPERGWLRALVRAAQSGKRVGMVASRVLLAHRPDLLDSAGIEVDVLGIAWNRGFGTPVSQDPMERVEIFGPAGSAALYLKAMLDEIGFFDERYFAYYEDVELAWRARRAGWRCLYAPDAIVVHQHSATGRSGSAFKSYHLSRNRIWTLIRHYPTRQFLVWWPFILLFDVASWLYPLLQGQASGLKGRIHAIRWCRAMWHERSRCARWQCPVRLVPPRLKRHRIPES